MNHTKILSKESKSLKNLIETELLEKYSIIKQNGECIALIPNRYIEQSETRQRIEKTYGIILKLHKIYELNKPISNYDFRIE